MRILFIIHLYTIYHLLAVSFSELLFSVSFLVFIRLFSTHNNQYISFFLAQQCYQYLFRPFCEGFNSKLFVSRRLSGKTFETLQRQRIGLRNSLSTELHKSCSTSSPSRVPVFVTLTDNFTFSPILTVSGSFFLLGIQSGVTKCVPKFVVFLQITIGFPFML